MSCNGAGGLILGNTTHTIRHTLSPCSGCHAIVSEGLYTVTVLLTIGKHSHPGQSVMQWCRGSRTYQHSLCHTAYTLTVLKLLYNCVRGIVSCNTTPAIPRTPLPCLVFYAMVSKGLYLTTLLLPYGVHSHPAQSCNAVQGLVHGERTVVWGYSHHAQSIMEGCLRVHVWEHYSCRTAYALPIVLEGLYMAILLLLYGIHSYCAQCVTQ